MKYFLSLILIVFTTSIYAVQYAYVKKPKAIVYADKELKVPIGYIAIGKKLTVSEKRFSRGKVTPLIVTGKVAYVKSDDLSFDMDGNKIQGAPVLKEHNVDYIIKTDQDKLTENNFLTLTYGNQAAGAGLDDASTKTNSDTFSLTTTSLRIEHRSPREKYGFAIAFSYIGGSSEELSFATLVGEGEYQRRFISTSFFSIEAYGGLGFSGDARFKVATTGEESRGVLWGYSFGARARLFPFSKYGAWASVGYSKYSLASFEQVNIETSNGREEFILGNVGGAKIEFGFSYQL